MGEHRLLFQESFSFLKWALQWLAWPSSPLPHVNLDRERLGALTVVKSVPSRWPDWFTLEIDSVWRSSHCASEAWSPGGGEGERRHQVAKSAPPALQGALEGTTFSCLEPPCWGLACGWHRVGAQSMFKTRLLLCWWPSFIKVESLSLAPWGICAWLMGEAGSAPCAECPQLSPAHLYPYSYSLQ